LIGSGEDTRAYRVLLKEKESTILRECGIEPRNKGGEGRRFCKNVDLNPITKAERVEDSVRMWN
jgi:hypothetical protein